ncbi:outer membrane protein transport protein [candidate division KSB1 bacterium]|nr:outer membrane protein transport protein [candidate division KSB1 bacterium]
MKQVIFILLAGALLLPGLAFGQTEVFFLGHQWGIGAKALAMGGAFSAVADDYTASYWNPAGLAQIHRMELLGSMSHFVMKNDARYLQNSSPTETNATKLNAFGFVIPYPTYRGSLVFSVGYNRVRSFDEGFGIQHYFHPSETTAYTQSYDELESGSLSNWIFSGALEVTQNLALGASINIWRGNDDYEWIREYDSELNLFDYDRTSNLNIETKYHAVNFKLGALYRLGILGRIGVTMSTPVKLKADESWSQKVRDFDNYDPAYADSVFEYKDYGNWDYSIKSPIIMGAGGAFTLFPNLVVSGDVEYSDWTQMKYESEPSVGDQIEENRKFKREYRATTQIHVGAEFTVPIVNLQLRGGFFNRPLPFKDATKQQDRKFLTAGVGMLLDKQVKLDVAWLHGWWKDQSYLSEDIPMLTEKIETDKILATIAFRF